MKIYTLLAILGISSCQSNTSEKEIKFFDTQKQVFSLIAEMSVVNPSVEKEFIFNNTIENNKVTDINWEKELKVFSDSDINKSSFFSSYDSTVSKNHITYRLKPTDKLPVKKLTIKFDSKQRPIAIYSIKNSKNFFYDTYSESEMQFKNSLVESYHIFSVQKLLWFSPDTTIITGKPNL